VGANTVHESARLHFVCGGLLFILNLNTIAMKFINIFFAAFLMMTFSNCELQQFEQDLLDSQREDWKSHNISDYSYTFTENCACSETEDIDIVVVSNQVSSATYSDSGIPVTGDDLARVRTIDEVFDIIQEAIDDGYFFINIDYHLEYDYPSIFEIDPDGGIDDDIVIYSIQNFTI
jgi:hypothetical protein